MKYIKLKNIRLEHQYTLKGLADKLGVTHAYIWQIENGARKLNYDFAVKIAKVFNLKPDDIFYGDAS